MRAPFLRALTQRDFAILWAGQTISLVGNGIFQVALAWQALQLPSPARTLGTVLVVSSGSRVAVLLIAGALADRYQKRLLMLTGDAIQMTAIAWLAYASATGDVAPWQLATVAGFNGAGSGVFLASSNAMVPELVDEDYLQSANSLRSASIVLADLFGSAAGGVLVAAAGTAAAYTLDAATFLASIAALAFVRPRLRAAPDDEGNVFMQVKQGLGYVARAPWIWVTLVAVGTIGNCISWGPLPVLVPLLVDTELGGGAEVLGFVFAGYGLGGLLGAVVAGSTSRRFASTVPAYAGWMIGCVGIGAVALAPNALFAAVAFAFVGLFGQMAEVVWATLLQRYVPPNLLGRVTSTDWLVSLSLQPLGVALAAPIAAGIGVRATMAGGAAVAIAVMGAGIAVPAVRRLSRT